MNRITILDWPTSITGWIVYLIAGVGSLAAVAFFARGAIPSWVYFIELIRRRSTRRDAKFVPLNPLTNLAIVVAGVISSVMCLVFVSLFFQLIVFEPVQAVSLNSDGIRLEYRLPWRNRFIKRGDIRSIRLTEHDKGKYGKTLPPSRRYHILTITTDKSDYVINPHEWGHDSKVLAVYGELQNLEKRIGSASADDGTPAVRDARPLKRTLRLGSQNAVDND